MSRISRTWLALMVALCLGSAARAEGFTGLARLQPAQSAIAAAGGGVAVRLSLSQGVPWRVFTLDGPPRLVLDFREVDWAGAGAADLIATGRVRGLRMGQIRPGWSRMVADLADAYPLEEAGLTVDPGTGAAVLRLRLGRADAARFAAAAGVPDSPGWDPAARGDGPPPPPPPRDAEGPLRVVIDPGHGGIDPGAEAGGLNEKTLMLAFARELQEALIRGGLFDVALTRERDEFVPLDTRISRARAAGASVFLSLHADELPEGAGDASGITVYTLAETATDEASLRLAERHDKNDLLAGVSVAEPGDEIALVLMDLARTDTGPRSAALAETLKSAFRSEALPLVGRPLRSAAFSVLKAADFPSALIELGFLSSEADRARLTDPEWRAAAIRAIETALVQWSLDDSARSGLLRQ